MEEPLMEDFLTKIERKTEMKSLDHDPYRKVFSELALSDSGFVLKGEKSSFQAPCGKCQ